MKSVNEQVFMVIDFETVTPKGVPPEPIQLGMVQIENLQICDSKQKSWFIKPPDFAPLTSFDTKQTGITINNLVNAKSSSEIFDIVELVCSKNNYIFIAQNANYELSICKRFYEGRDNLSAIKFIDTIKLAKIAFPNEKSYKLDNLANLLNVPIPSGRHTAIIDCIITGNVFTKLVEKINITSVTDLIDKACINKNKEDSIQMKFF